MKICAGIVTYGDRFSLLKNGLDFLSNSIIDHIVLIDNGSLEKSKLAIKKYVLESTKPITLVEHPVNYGSSKGFKSAIENSLNTGADFILLLDDDNLLRQGSLEVMLTFWTEKVEVKKSSLTALVANRINRKNFKEVIQKNDPMAILQPYDNYLGFHWALYLEKIKERIGLLKNKEIDPKNFDAVKVAAAPYSGLFFHKELIGKIGLPNEDYLLYMDDFEFTYRITKLRGEIWLLPHVMVDDLEESTYLPKQKKFLYHSLFDGHRSQMYYAFRNMLVFGKAHLRRSYLIFLINKYSFWTIIFIMAILRGKLFKLKVIIDAQKDARSGNLGLNDSYPLN